MQEQGSFGENPPCAAVRAPPIRASAGMSSFQRFVQVLYHLDLESASGPAADVINELLRGLRGGFCNKHPPLELDR